MSTTKQPALLAEYYWLRAIESAEIQLAVAARIYERTMWLMLLEAADQGELT